MSDDKKYWVYINNWHGKVRIFGTAKSGEKQIAIRLNSMDDAEKVKELFEKAGHEEVLAGESYALGDNSPRPQGKDVCY